MRLLYSIIFYLCLPLVITRLLWRARKAPAYRQRWAERFGLVSLPPLAAKRVWVHAVSVGETIAAEPLIKQLLQLPNTEVLVTSMTPTGSAQVRKTFGGQVLHVYAPYDLPTCVARFLNRAKPTCLIVMETELWPNTIAACAKRTIPVILANGRLSEKSAKGYGKIRGLIAPALQQLSCAAVQHHDDGQRLIDLGLPADRCVVTGSIKFDLTISDAVKHAATQLRESIHKAQSRIVWLAASTHRGEDEIIIDAFKTAQQKIPSLFLIIVPRHPERFNEVASLCEQARLSLQRRSQAEPVHAHTNVLLGDSMGELLMFYGVADFTLVGGSFVPVGGHNLIEPAAWGLPIMSGPHLFNFSEVSRLLSAADALCICHNATEIAARVIELAEKSEVRLAMGDRAREIAEANRGALEKLLTLVKPYCS